MYVTNKSDTFLSSRQTCTELGKISVSFLTIGKVDDNKSSTLNASTDKSAKKIVIATTATSTSESLGWCGSPESALTSNCSYLKQERPQTRSTTLPFPATEVNREKLKTWLLDYYSSSTFNICTHQLLPMMETKPLRLMINPDPSPIAHHTPVPVPIHWQDDVKAD